MDARHRHPEDADAASRRALEHALSGYLKGSADLRAAAKEAGMDDFEFLKEANSMPDPGAAEAKVDLPTFVRDRQPRQ